MVKKIEGVKDKLLGGVTYKTRTTKFEDVAELLKVLSKGDFVVAGEDAKVVDLEPGSAHEVKSVNGTAIKLSDGKEFQVEFFDPVVKRRERIRKKADPRAVRRLVTVFVGNRWAAFKANAGSLITASKESVARAQEGLKQAQARLEDVQKSLESLENVGADEKAWSASLTEKMVALVTSKLYANFEMIEEEEKQVLVAYTGLIEDSITKVRTEYAVKIFPAGSKTRIMVENITPGKDKFDVPFHENRTGVCNICFGDQSSDFQNVVNEENWVKALTLVHSFLAGNRAKGGE